MSAGDEWIGTRPTGHNSHFDSPDAWNVRVSRSLYGARAFLASEDGWLTGVTYRKIWTPGVNLAECFRVTGWNVHGIGVVEERPGKAWHDEFTGRVLETPGGRRPETVRVFDGWTWKLDSGEKGVATREPKPVYGNEGNPKHDLTSCGCGFHAYLRGSLDYSSDKLAVNGIVRAFGRIRRCKRGLRAQMAEIVALYIPVETPEPLLRPANHEHLRHGLLHAGKALVPEQVDAIRSNYPNVPIYSDLEQMLEAHPTEEPS